MLSEERLRQIVKEEHPEVLTKLIMSMNHEIERLRGRVAEIEAETAQKDQHILNIEESIKVMRNTVYGASSEKRPEPTDRARDKSQEAALIFSQATFPCLETRDEAKSRLEKTEVEHGLTRDELQGESKARDIKNPSAEQWQELDGVYDKVTLVQVHERRYVLEVHKKKKYKLRSEFNDSDKDVIITAHGPSALLPGMSYATEFVASVVADKYISHMPLERQTREMESLGLKSVKTSTLSRLCALAAGALDQLPEKILNEIKAADTALNVDETPWNIQNKNQKDGFMWVISNRVGSYYFFKPTRSGQVIKEKLEGYSGPVMTDGYSGYNILDEIGIKQGYCWAHARRQFYQLEEHDPTVKPILDDIDELFAIERRAQSFTELENLRRSDSRPVINRLQDRLIKERQPSASREGSHKRKAIDYVLKRWSGFTAFLSDTRLPLSNNEAERTIRHAVVGRKNYYGANTHSGAETAATLFTIIESCKKNDIDPRSFLLMSLQAAARSEELVTPLEYARQLRQ